MATLETICKFNQSGFCKFLANCRKQHVMEICPTIQCNNKNSDTPRSASTSHTLDVVSSVISVPIFTVILTTLWMWKLVKLKVK